MCVSAQKNVTDLEKRCGKRGAVPRPLVLKFSPDCTKSQQKNYAKDLNFGTIGGPLIWEARGRRNPSKEHTSSGWDDLHRTKDLCIIN